MGVAFLSAVEVTTTGTTVNVLVLGVVDVTTGAEQIGIFFGSSVKTRRHLQRRKRMIIDIVELSFVRCTHLWHCA